jgi:polyisoprenoid-binding protein YceI
MRYRWGLAMVLAVLAGVSHVKGVYGADDLYQVDPSHTSVNFMVRHLAIYKVRGQFHKFAGTIRYDQADVTQSALEGTIQVDSIDTEHAKRDNDLRGEQFFDAEHFPTITFASQRVEKRDAGYVLIGTMTLHGVSKEVAIPFSLTGPVVHLGKTLLGFEASFEINRQDFGITYAKVMDSGGLVVGNTVHIELSGRAVKQAP